jgi:hypothetical protein
VKIVIIISIILTSLFSKFDAKFISPIGYDYSYKQRIKVIRYIKLYVRDKFEYNEIERRASLKILEYKEANSFRKLLKAKNKKVLKKTIKELCKINQCGYLPIWLIYDQRIRALIRPKYIYDANKTFKKNRIDSYY